MRTKKGTFGKMQQISTENDFLNVEKNGFFSMVFAPYEGRLIKFVMSGPYDEPAYIEFKNQKHEMQYAFLQEDDFEIPSEEYLKELLSFEPNDIQINLVNLCTDLAFDPNDKTAKLTLHFIKAYAERFDVVKDALSLVRIAMNTRRVVKTPSLSSL